MIYYVHGHLQSLHGIPNVVEGISAFVMSSWKSENAHQLLDLSLSSIALVTYARTQTNREAAYLEASQTYQQLLRQAQVDMQPLAEKSVDICLLSIHHMSRFENSVYQAGSASARSRSLPSYSHDDGAKAMLRYWKVNLGGAQQTMGVIKQVRRGVIRSSLLRHLEIPGWMHDGAEFGEQGLELAFDQIVVEIADIQQRLHNLVSGINSRQIKPLEDRSEVEDLMRAAADLDARLEEWPARFPQEWRYERHDLPEPFPWPLRDFFTPVVYSYLEPSFAAAWNQYFATRMLLNSALLRLLDLGGNGQGSQDWRRCKSRLRSLADDLANSIPFSLLRFKLKEDADSAGRQKVILDTWTSIPPFVANLAIWPLTLASYLKCLDTDQRNWFRSELARLGRIVGAGILEAAETEDWLEL